MSAAAASVLLGAGLVAALLGLSLLVVRLVSRVSPTAVAPALALSYLVKAFVLGWVLLNVPSPGWLEPWWLGGSVMVSLASWLTVQAAAAARASRAAGAELARVRAARGTEAAAPPVTLQNPAADPLGGPPAGPDRGVTP